MATTPSGKRAAAHVDAAHQEMREQEVLRANRELAAYFRGRRTEREARGALKIIKAFIRDRERVDPGKRRPLPGSGKAPKVIRTRKKVGTRRNIVKRPPVEAPESAATPPEPPE